MENYLNEKHPEKIEGEDMGKKILIATMYHAKPVIVAATKSGADKLILLINDKPDEDQKKSIKQIREGLGIALELEFVKTDMYNILEVAKICVDLIDKQDKEDRIYVNITGGRKTKAIALLFAAYARSDRVNKIAYNTEETGDVIYLPMMKFAITTTQKTILEQINKGYKTMADLAIKVELSKAMTYKHVQDLTNLELIKDEEGLKLTDAGRITLL